MSQKGRSHTKKPVKASAEPGRARSPFEPRPFPVQARQDRLPSGEQKGPDLYDNYLEKRRAAAEAGAPGDVVQQRSGESRKESKAGDNESLVSGPNKGAKTALPDKLKTGLEALSGLPMDDVAVHYNSSKPAKLGAEAYARGTDVHIGPGHERHLPHEAWHVAQQKQGRVKPTRKMEGVDVNLDDGLEREADVMGAKALQMKAVADPVVQFPKKSKNKNKNKPGDEKKQESSGPSEEAQKTTIAFLETLVNEKMIKPKDNFKYKNQATDLLFETGSKSHRSHGGNFSKSVSFKAWLSDWWDPFGKNYADTTIGTWVYKHL